MRDSYKNSFSTQNRLDVKSSSVLWAYRTVEKITTRRTPFYLTYGLDSIVPIEFDLPTYRIINSPRLGVEASQLCRLQQLEQVEGIVLLLWSSLSCSRQGERKSMIRS